jgi:hypothetical protein
MENIENIDPKDSYALSKAADLYLKAHGFTIWGRDKSDSQYEQREFERARILYNNNGPKK